MDSQRLSGKSKLSYALGAVGKDMVYMLSASYVLYYFQDLLGVEAWIMGVILLVARVFDAFNDPIMGVVVAKTKTRWGRFRPWLLIGTVTNAVILYFMFAAPPAMDAKGLTAYAAIFYILWGVTYTMMDIPYWSMIPAFTQGGKERENLTTIARSCAGVGAAIITVFTMMLVPRLGAMFAGENAGAKLIEVVGFKYFAAIVGVLFIVFIGLTCLNVKEKSTASMETVSVKQMFKALVQNDQAMTVTIAIVLVNTAIYITSNLVIYFFKYDFGTVGWNDAYVLFNTFGGAIQILAMMLFYPLLRKKFSNRTIFDLCLGLAVLGYVVLLGLAFTNMNSVFVLFVPAFCIFSANGILSVITTVFLANTVDYGELKNGRRDESVIFSMQTFVVKLASGIAALAASICLSVNKLSDEAITEEAKHVDWSLGVSAAAKTGLRMTMTVIPIIGLIFAFFWFRKKFILNDKKVEEIAAQVKKLHE
ncbi:MAG: MFS transporter [Oscillospiraceae bacterium]|nr:MFS transporter [Oscillospiraceae bacterium]MBR7010998.1 MFS transporter [Oscillospiraceae bacterium]